ncbi:MULTISPECIES: PRC-barrel domain-containing protein [Megamonas]|jgi:uncharacterized protein YrrD|uniref:PRC-barrel domain-containing protein n=1 Tax=Megamonas TaxID=158846 RepID=UPI001CD3C729|nr:MULTISPECIES: PRC-barrel domain-containing protein [Megamonas]UBS48650.1 PRC-barrel domain-containing protein [Megamonas funiformis]GLU97978.1 hypothetical protein Mfun01_06230 [Megamonas funiformis]
MTTYESKQLLKPVMSIIEGIELGTVSDIIIDGENKKVIALGITKDKLFYKALCVIPFEKISSINEDNILVMSSKDIISYKDFNLDLEKILQDRINILNTICLSGGKKCGTVTEYTIDEQGNILNCKIIYAKTVNVQDINIFAKDYTIMKNTDNTEVISTKKIDNVITKQDEPIQKATVIQSTKQNTKNEKNINDKNLNLTYKMFLGKTLKEPLTINNKTYPVDTVLTKQMIDDIIAVNKINALGKFVNM